MDVNPFAPPKAKVADPVRSESTPGFRDLSSLTRLVAVLLVTGILVKCLSIVSEVMQLSLLGRASFTQEEAVYNDLRQSLLSVGSVLLYVLTRIIFARWLYLAHRNLPGVGAENQRFRPAWAIGTFFVPIANLWMPCQAMSDLVRASRDPRQWHLDSTPALVVFGWILWVTVTLVGNAALGFQAQTGQSVSIAALQDATVVQIALSALSIPLYVLARQIIACVWRDQLRAAPK